MMKKYFKTVFESFAVKYKFKSRVRYISRKTSQQYFVEFIEQNHQFLNTCEQANVDFNDLVVSLETIVLCDRYNK